MKKALLVTVLGVAATAQLHAQDIESAKKFLILTKYKEAKTDIDKAVVNPKYSSKPEAWLVKSSVYSALASSGVPKEDSINYRKEAFDALQKYSQLEPSNAMVTDAKYSDVPRQLYVAYFNSGIAQFNEKDWANAFTNLKAAAGLSDYLIKSKILPGPIDTNAVLYTGASAQNGKMEADAVTWYTKLADAKVAGKDNEFIYQYLTDYYLRKRDNENFGKYETLGKQLYPESKYFSAIGADYARSSTDFNDVIKFYQEKAAASPTDYQLQYDLGAEIFDHLYPRDSAKIPTGDVSSWETTMIGAFTKASELKPEKGMPLAVIGSHFAKKAEKVNASIDSIGTAIKNANRGAKPDKTGKLPPAPKELLTARENLYKDYYSTLDQAAEYYVKASDRFAKETGLQGVEKSFYKNAASNLIDIYQMKKNNAKGKPADIAKFAAEQKKWEGIYDSIK